LSTSHADDRKMTAPGRHSVRALGAGSLAPYLAFAAAGIRRYATYRQAMVASIFTNSVFGFLRCSVLLALAAGGTVAGYDAGRLATFVWAGQGLKLVVQGG
jgi:ABC-2 type transport system permease protein